MVPKPCNVVTFCKTKSRSKIRVPPFKLTVPAIGYTLSKVQSVELFSRAKPFLNQPKPSIVLSESACANSK